MNDDLFQGLPNVTITGRYDEDDLDELVDVYRPSLSFFPNQWPETYSYTLSHALRFGLYPVVTDIGAPAERVRAAGFGAVIPLGQDADRTVRFLLDVGCSSVTR